MDSKYIKIVSVQGIRSHVVYPVNVIYIYIYIPKKIQTHEYSHLWLPCNSYRIVLKKMVTPWLSSSDNVHSFHKSSKAKLTGNKPSGL